MVVRPSVLFDLLAFFLSLAVLNQFRDAAHASGDRHYFTGHSFECGQPERFKFAGQEQDVG